MLVALGAQFASSGLAHADEAGDRKARSIAILVGQGVPYNDHLPVIETEAQSLRRSEDEVAERLIALTIVAVTADSADREFGKSLLAEFGAHGFLTPRERAFLSSEALDYDARVQFLWRYEAAHVLSWALGLEHEMLPPDRVIDVKDFVDTLRDLGTEGVLAEAILRPQAEILDAADLIYRYHWAVVDARINGRDVPPGLDGSVVYERHYALNWLIGYLGQDWDNISTDT